MGPMSEEILFKTTLKMTISKFQFKISKMRSLNKVTLNQLSRDLSDLTDTTGTKFDRGLMLTKIRISKLINEDNLIDIYEILMIDCELLLSKLNQLVGKSDDENMMKLIKKLMFCSNYVNIKEFRKLIMLLANKYGKPFYESALAEFDDNDIITKCKNENVDGLVDLYLTEICESYGIDLYGTKKGTNEGGEDDDNGEGGGKGEAVLADEAKPVREAPLTVSDSELKPTVTKKTDDIDDLKKRFSALKRI